jgi:hypothetical protein
VIAALLEPLPPALEVVAAPEPEPPNESKPLVEAAVASLPDPDPDAVEDVRLTRVGF